MKLVEYTKTVNGQVVTKKHYPKLYGKARKQEKRDEADERKKDWDKLTLEQKFNELDKRPGSCTKERERLAKRIKA